MRKRRDKPSCRPLKLSEEQAIELRAWYYSARTVAQKARELGISRFALYNYVNYKHKPRKDSLDAISGELTTPSVKFHDEQRAASEATVLSIR